MNPLESLKNEALGNVNTYISSASYASRQRNDKEAQAHLYKALVFGAIASMCILKQQGVFINQNTLEQCLRTVIPADVYNLGLQLGLFASALGDAEAMLNNTLQGNNFTNNSFGSFSNQGLGSFNTGSGGYRGNSYGAVNVNNQSLANNQSFSSSGLLVPAGQEPSRAPSNTFSSGGRYGQEPIAAPTPAPIEVKTSLVANIPEVNKPVVTEKSMFLRDWLCEEGISIALVNGKEEATGSPTRASTFSLEDISNQDPIELESMLDRIVMEYPSNTLVKAKYKHTYSRYAKKDDMPSDFFNLECAYLNAALALETKDGYLTNVDDFSNVREYINSIKTIKTRQHLKEIYKYIADLVDVKTDLIGDTEAKYTFIHKLTCPIEDEAYFVYSDTLYKLLDRPKLRNFVSKYTYNGFYNILTEIFKNNESKFIHIYVVSESGIKEIVVSHTDILEDEPTENKLFITTALVA